MCETCGCGNTEGIVFTRPGQVHGHSGNDHSHEHNHPHSHKVVLQVQEDVLGANNKAAAHNREHLAANGILALNLMSSPGSGKTTLLEMTINALSGQYKWAVVEGDQQTTLDADRIHATGALTIQVNTGTGCHLDADMLHHAIHELELSPNSILAIENVGNLVCPALFDLGEAYRVIIVSTTEGADKPLKYPTILADADLCILNKIDLLPYVDFDVEAFKANALQVNPNLSFLLVSATTGEGMDDWYRWITEKYATVDTV